MTFGSVSSFSSEPTAWMLWATPRDAKNIAQTVSSLTALAFAPGELNTGIPRSVMRSTGMLFVPAPQRAMARTEVSTSSSCSPWLRSIMACGSAESGSTRYISFG